MGRPKVHRLADSLIELSRQAETLLSKYAEGIRYEKGMNIKQVMLQTADAIDKEVAELNLLVNASDFTEPKKAQARRLRWCSAPVS